MHFELVVSTSEHTGCLASLQHCLVHWVSPFGDLTLSPGVLWVPTWARYFHQHFCSSFINILARGLSILDDYAVLRGMTQFFLAGVLDWGFAGRFVLGGWARDQPLHIGGFWLSFRQSCDGFISVAAQSLEGLRKSPRGWFSGVNNFRKAFWAFLGLLSRRWFQSFNIFWGGEKPQILILFQQ